MLTLRTSPQRAVGPSLLPSFMLQLSDLCAGFPVSTHRCCYPDWCPLSGGFRPKPASLKLPGKWVGMGLPGPAGSLRMKLRPQNSPSRAAFSKVSQCKRKLHMQARSEILDALPWSCPNLLFLVLPSSLKGLHLAASFPSWGLSADPHSSVQFLMSWLWSRCQHWVPLM